MPEWLEMLGRRCRGRLLGIGLGFEVLGTLAVLGLTLALWVGGRRKSGVRKAVGFIFFWSAAMLLWDCATELERAWKYSDYEDAAYLLIMAGVPGVVGLWLLLEGRAGPCVVCGQPAWVGLRVHEGHVCNERCLYRYLVDAPDEALRLRGARLEASLHRVSLTLCLGAVCAVVGLALTPFSSERAAGLVAGLLLLAGVLLLCLVVPLKRLVLLWHAARARQLTRVASD